MTEGSILSEFLVIPGNSQENPEESYKWTHQNTLLFLELYKEYRDKVGSLKIKNIKRMFEEICKEMQEITKKCITPANCENRWKVLERNYKKYIDNVNKTGRGRKVFEYYNIMNDILGKKKNINPILLLSSDTTENNLNIINTENEIMNDTEVGNMETEPPSSSKNIQKETLLETEKSVGKRKDTITQNKKTYESKRLKFNILKEIRNDRKKFYAQRLDIEEKKLQAKITKNELLEKLIKKCKCNCNCSTQHIPTL